MSQAKLPAADTPARHLHDALGGHQGLNAPKLTAADRLAAIRALRARLDEEEQQLAFAERLRGATWDEIAAMWGLASRQRAQQVFGAAASLDKLRAATAE